MIILFFLLHVNCNFHWFCEWLVCCLTGFYQPNWDGNDDPDEHIERALRQGKLREIIKCLLTRF